MTMRAARLLRHDGVGGIAIESVAMPTRAPGEVLVRLEGACLNRVDLYMAGGGAGITHPLPLTLGVDGAGEVVECDPGEALLGVGKKVAIYPGIWCGRCEFCRRGDQILCTKLRLIGEHRDGTFAEYISVPAANLFPIPSGWSAVEAAALPVAGLTAWRMLVTKGRVRPGQVVLIFGIGGGVSLFALQLAKMLGAETIVTSSSAAKLVRAQEFGAAHTIHHGQEDVLKRVMAITGGRGVDLVVENVGKATWDIAMRAVVRGGSIVCCGATTGGNPSADLQRLFIRQISVLGSTLGNPGEFADLLTAAGADPFRPVIDAEFGLAEVPQALHRLEQGLQLGKIAIRI
jgi:NADPH:quinone reductase-like Zn-dependent oxidoreductase